MATRVQGIHDGYSKVLEDVNKISEQLYRLGYGLNDLGYFGYNSDSIQKEWKHYNSIKQALIELQNELNKALGNENE